ncbi:major facilitator superfamily domain-containing protein [Ilyonectria destructans]|nr:major facilitator superfamily domain-containing protein [Ilyonectria destructans]
MDEKFDNSNIGVSALTGTVESIDTNGPEARKVLRKIDCHLLPILAVTYFIQFLDKSCVSYAALWGMREDAHLEGSQYSWLTTMFYIGYLVSEFPINVLFQKFDIARTCGIFIILWGIVLLCMTAAHDFAGLATARFFLGALEAGVSPCFVLLTAMFYKRSEQPFRTSLWFSMNGMANILGGLLGYAIGFIDADIPTWKFPFVIFGSLTIVWGVIFLFITPSNPTTAKWLTQEEKAIAVMRLAENETGIDNKQWKWHQVKEAVMDPRFWLLNLLALANNIPNGGVSAFGPLIVNGFGYSQFQSTLLNMPSGAAQIMALWTSGFLATRLKGARHFLMLGGICVAIVGASLIYAMPDNRKVPRLLGYYLLVGFSVVWVLALTFVQANVAGRTKKTIFASSVFVSYCLGNIIGPQLFFSYEAPRYQSGFAAMIVCFCVQILLVTAMYFVNWRENTRRDRLATGDNDVDRDVDVALGLSDLTDKENLHFRYVL